MAPPPAEPEDPRAFEKISGKPSHHHPSHPSRQDRYDDDKAAQGNWLVAGIVAVMLVVGGWLIFSGLL